MIARLNSTDRNFNSQLQERLFLPEEDREEVLATVRMIVDNVRTRGDDAVLELTRQFDGLTAGSINDLEISRERQRQGFESIDQSVREALETATDRIRSYHLKQKQVFGNGMDWDFIDDAGNRLGQLVRGMERVGIYTPGGKAAYPSTLLMSAIPARVADVGEIILTVPTPDGEVNDALLAALYLCNIDRVFTVGGAQAIAALAYGTECIPRVDKIVGPGNIYVATAKEMVFGDVGIEMIAGPSEVVIVADSSANPEWLTLDMFAQAEHDEMAQAILISPDDEILNQVSKLLSHRLAAMPRQAIIRQSLERRGALLKVRNLDEAMGIVNNIAPEHLELALQAPDEALGLVRHAGAIFVGNHSGEAVGDYIAGPSHVLPTGGNPRFASPLGVYDFQVRSSIIQCSVEGADALGKDAAIIARQEGLHAHAESAECRMEADFKTAPD